MKNDDADYTELRKALRDLDEVDASDTSEYSSAVQSVIFQGGKAAKDLLQEVDTLRHLLGKADDLADALVEVKVAEESRAIGPRWSSRVLKARRAVPERLADYVAARGRKGGSPAQGEKLMQALDDLGDDICPVTKKPHTRDQLELVGYPTGKMIGAAQLVRCRDCHQEQTVPSGTVSG